jgi:hypothetical protein
VFRTETGTATYQQPDSHESIGVHGTERSESEATAELERSRGKILAATRSNLKNAGAIDAGGAFKNDAR